MLKIGRSVESEPGRRPRPNNIDGFYCFERGEFVAFVHEKSVLEKLQHWTEERPDAEIIGGLIGRCFEDLRGPYVVVTDAKLAACANGRAASVATTPQDCIELIEAMKHKYPTQEMVGWFHSHVMDLHDYSLTDRRNQASWRLKQNLGLLVVLGTERTHIHAFCGPESERLEPAWVGRRTRVATAALPSPSDEKSLDDPRPKESRILWLDPGIAVMLMALITLACAANSLAALYEHDAQRAKLVDAAQQLREQADLTREETQRQGEQIERLLAERRGGDELPWLSWLGRSVSQVLKQGDDHENDRARRIP